MAVKLFRKMKYNQFFESMDFIIFPDVNPDGRFHSQTNEAMWRKNRNPADSGGEDRCIGVDLNRNF